MPINYIPNDPRMLGNLVAMRQVTPAPNRPAGRAGFVFSGQVPAGIFTPGIPGFLFWQCREAAITALVAWEKITGKPFTKWQGGAKIRLMQNAGTDLNAFYDRVSLSFFQATVAGTTFFSGASTDVVAHEAGHGILDALRPALIESNQFEVNSFHEAFGDCVAIVTALCDNATRAAVLAKLGQANGVESTAEELSFAIGKAVPGHNAAKPRTANNAFRWVPPVTLPTTGGPGVLIREIHSFCQVFTGCFYDLILNILNRLPGGKTDANLLKAATTAGSLLAPAAQQAPLQVQFFRSVGRTMALIDAQSNGGANADSIRSAFLQHGIGLGSAIMLAPQTVLAGAAPLGAKIGAALKGDLRRRLQMAPGAKLLANVVEIAGNKVTESIHSRLVGLGHLSSKLKGVLASAQDSVLVGEVNTRAVVLGDIPSAEDSVADVESFVQSLLDHDKIHFPGKKGIVASELKSTATHVIRTIRGKKVLTRIRYQCGEHGAVQLTGPAGGFT
ncbi:MAG: hypothetical protein ACKV0T_13305 [Planctomycetales bacterium]